MEQSNRPIILLTGGSGFLGRAIVNELIDAASLINPGEIRIFDKNQYTGPQDERINFISGDIRNYIEVKEACKGVDVVIHSAALIDWGIHPKSVVFGINVGGTENIIKACLENNIHNLVYTSSLDAVYRGTPLVDIDETIDYPVKHKSNYGESKNLAEVRVMEANDQNLKTIVLRPSDIYGEGDPYHVESLINMAKTGFYIRLGNGKSKCQHVYVSNMAHAHVLAAKALLNNNDNVYGNVYFITDGPPSNFFKFFDKIVVGSGYKLFPKNLWMPRWIAYSIASAVEFIAFILKPIKKTNPKFSRFAVEYTCNDFTFKTDRAKIDFGFTPRYSQQEAFERTIAYYKKP